MLEHAAGVLKPGAALVYATCSSEPEENEQIVSAFLKNHPEFRQLDCEQLLNQHGISIATGAEMRLWPHIHGTDGFFAAAFERVQR